MLKNKIAIIAVVVVVITGISVLVFREASYIIHDHSLRNIEYLAYSRAEYWAGRVNSRFMVLRTLADIMEDYESLDPSIRRDRFDDMLRSIIASDESIISLYTIWKPNHVDGMDSLYIGRVGSSPTGQYAMSYTRENRRLVSQTSTDIEDSMAWFNGPSSRMERVEQPFAGNLGGKDTILFRTMVPIVNPRTNETVGGIGCLLDLSDVQYILQQTVNYNEEIAAMAFYSSNGLILGHYIPERIGQMMLDVEQEYGAFLVQAQQAVVRGMSLQNNLYVGAYNTNIEFVFVSFLIGNSDLTWTLMMGATESYIMMGANHLARFTIVLAVTALIITVVIVSLVLNSVRKFGSEGLANSY